MKLTIDWSNAGDGGGPTLHPEGTYEFRCIKPPELKQSKSGSQLIYFPLASKKGELRHMNVIDGKDNNTFLMRTLDAFGFDVGGKQEFDFDQCVGKSIVGTVQHNESEYNGKVYKNSNLAATYRASDPSLQHLDVEWLGKSAPKAASPAPDFADDDDDIPF